MPTGAWPSASVAVADAGTDADARAASRRSHDLTERAARRAALAMAPGVLIAGIGGGMAFPIVPHVGRAAGMSLGLIGLVLAANRIGRVIASPAVGAAVDRRGGKRILLAGLAIQLVALGLYMAAVAWRLPGPLFLLGRATHGLASACVFISSQALALRAGGHTHRGYVGGVVRSAQAVGVPLGLLAGGLLSALCGPLDAFAVAAAVTLLALWLAHRAVPDLRGARVPAATFLTALRALGQRPVAVLAGVNFTANFVGQGVVLALMTLMVEERQIARGMLGPELATGLLMGLMTACMLAVTPAAARVADRPGRRAVALALGLGCMVPGMVLLATAHGGVAVAASLAWLGVGSGLVAPPLLTLMADLVAPERHGSAIAALQLGGDVGGSLGPLLASLLFMAHQPALFVVSFVLLIVTLPLTAILHRHEAAA